MIGLKSGEQTRAYPIETIRAAPGGVVEDEFAGQTVTLRVDSDTGTVAVGELPDGVAAIHTFWFAWYAFHPETGLYDPEGRYQRILFG